MNDFTNFLPVPEKPGRIVIEEYAGGKRLRWRWFRPAAFALLLVWLVWTAMAGVFVFGVGRMVLASRELPYRWVLAIAPVCFALSSLWLGYLTLALFVNRSQVTVTPAEFSVRHGPLPWKGVRPIDPAQITGIGFRERVVHARGGTLCLWKLQATVADGTEITLIPGIESKELAEWVLCWLEDELRIARPE